MSKWYMVTLLHSITVDYDMFDHMDCIMQALAENLIQWKKDTYFAKSCARQNLSKYYTEVPLPMGMFLISAHSLDPFSKSRSFRK